MLTNFPYLLRRPSLKDVYNVLITLCAAGFFFYNVPLTEH